jgi:hypothetical protein
VPAAYISVHASDMLRACVCRHSVASQQYNRTTAQLSLRNCPNALSCPALLYCRRSTRSTEISCTETVQQQSSGDKKTSLELDAGVRALSAMKRSNRLRTLCLTRAKSWNRSLAVEALCSTLHTKAVAAVAAAAVIVAAVVAVALPAAVSRQRVMRLQPQRLPSKDRAQMITALDEQIHSHILWMEMHMHIVHC